MYNVIYTLKDGRTIMCKAIVRVTVTDPARNIDTYEGADIQQRGLPVYGTHRLHSHDETYTVQCDGDVAIRVTRA